MNLPDNLKDIYSKELLSAVQAQRLAHEISQGPVVFQVARLMIKFGIFQMLLNSSDGLSIDDIAREAKISKYAAKCLLESSLTTGTVLCKNKKFYCSKAGWFLLNDNSVRRNIDFNHHVNYKGLYSLEESFAKGKPEGLKVFGQWNTIYEGFTQLPETTQKAWLNFDHYYSNVSFEEALKIVFAQNPSTILDVGGNTGEWAIRCVQHDENVNVTIVDLPPQLKMMKKHIEGKNGVDRIHSYACNLLDSNASLPKDFDVIWMSQFLDCFSETQIIDILSMARKSMNTDTRLYIMETFWDRQRFDTAAYALTQISIYFTVMANGNSKMYHSEDMLSCIKKARLRVENSYDHLGNGHSIVVCRK